MDSVCVTDCCIAAGDESPLGSMRLGAGVLRAGTPNPFSYHGSPTARPSARPSVRPDPYIPPDTDVPAVAVKAANMDGRGGRRGGVG